jgi:hypothetical protein
LRKEAQRLLLWRTVEFGLDWAVRMLFCDCTDL